MKYELNSLLSGPSDINIILALYVNIKLNISYGLLSEKLKA